MIDPYNAKVRELFADTAHAGDLDGTAMGYFEDQGLRVRLAARIEKGRLSELRFRAYGCPHVIAACEWICRKFEGEAVEALEGFETGQIMADLAVPAEKTGRILVIEDTVRSLGQAIRDRATI